MAPTLPSTAGPDSSFYGKCEYSVVSPVTGKAVETGVEWQCVELVNRLYVTKGWITMTWHGDGDTMWKKAPPGPGGVPLKSEPQGSISHLAPGGRREHQRPAAPAVTRPPTGRAAMSLLSVRYRAPRSRS